MVDKALLSLGRLLVLFMSNMLPLHKSKSFHLVSTVWTVPEHGACWRDWRLEKPQVPGMAKQRDCSSGSYPTSVGRTLPRREEGTVQETRQFAGCWVSVILQTFSHWAGPKPYT